MNERLSKDGLYKAVDSLKSHYSIYPDECPVYLPDILVNNACKIIDIEECDFPHGTINGLGILADTADLKRDLIILDKNRSSAEKNFTCAHELIHLELQKPHTACTKFYMKTNKLIPYQDSVQEALANEGAAEILMPYRVFIPSLFYTANYFFSLEQENFWQAFECIISKLANTFNVEKQMIYKRIESLKAEILGFFSHQMVSEINLIDNIIGIKEDPFLATKSLLYYLSFQVDANNI